MSINRKYHSNINNFDTIPILENENFFLHFLYHTKLGRIFLWILIRPIISKIVGWVLNTKISTIFIKGFICKNHIDVTRFQEKKYQSFNDFFTRELKENPKLNSLAFSSPCDGKLSVYKISNDLVIDVKHSKYTIESLIQDKEIAQNYQNGYCLVFRLTPDDYHRYHFVDSGVITFQKRINGVLHTVRPIALKEHQVFTENAREVTVMETDHFGIMTQIEVGALMVGKIENTPKRKFEKGEEKGKFLFGGSTIILLLTKDRVNLNKEFEENTKVTLETLVHYNDILEKESKNEI